MRANAIAVLLLAVTGLLTALIGGALATGAALGFDGPGGRPGFVRRGEAPRRFWAYVAIYAVLLGLMIAVDVARLGAHPR
jgi:hypothetical protein